jgi:hypothetical protein
MCDMLTALTAATAASFLMTGYSQYQQGQYQKDLGNYNAKVDEIKATQALEAGVAAEDAHRAKVRQMIGQQRAGMGASGVEVDSGTFGDILADSAAQGEMDAVAHRTNAMREAWGYRESAKQSAAEGKWAGRSGAMNSLGTLLSGSLQTYNAGKKAGIWGK